MKRLVLCAALMMPLPLSAQETDGGVMQRGLELFLEGLRKEIDPALREIGPRLQEFTDLMGPAFEGLMAEIEDWSSYHPPEILPNGDIIIRRKTPDKDPAPSPDGQVDI